MIFKCKMCGGDLDIQEKMSIGTCQYCGTKQTLPRLDDDKRANLYERANHFRRQNDFDKASAIYDSILNEDNTDAEAYWSLVLCKYGVEYVEDPATRKRIPTCNRTQFSSILADEDYKQALAHADESQKSLYAEEAGIIDGIQKGILEVSNREEPFDIFICYKESDDSGRRTPDSVLAQDMYHQLTNEGFKVFFAKITLEDKIGTAYEPYIFAALQSSRIMIVLGTKPEFFTAVWVKNEWSRYLGLIKGGAKKTLIPAYRDMDPYTLPEEFSHLQAQDMGKLGFMQDLVRGIKKILDTTRASLSSSPAAPVASAVAVNPEALLQRAFIELEDGNWDKVDSLLEEVLNVEPQNVKAYVGKLMASAEARTEGDLVNCRYKLTDNNNYQKAIRFADDVYRARLEGYSRIVDERIERERALHEESQETQRKQQIFDKAMRAAETLTSVTRSSAAMAAAAKACREVAEQFRSISGFSTADDWVKEMEGRAESADRMASEESAHEFALRRNTRFAQIAARCGFWLIVLAAVAIYSPIIPSMKRSAAAKKQASERASEAKEEAAKQAAADKELAAARAEEKKQQAAERAEAKKKQDAKKAEEKKQQEAQDKLRSARYPAAQALVAAGKYSDAMKAFNEIGGYTFGKYNWRILDVKDGKALLITEDIIERKPFNAKQVNVDWEGSTLRKYLNGDFYNSFLGDDRDRIETTKLVNQKVGSFGGKTTKDKIFLLSLDEVKQYFKDDADRIARYNGDGNYSWWLRSLGTGNNKGDFANQYIFVAEANDLGHKLDERGTFVDIESGVRPALWVNLKS